MQNQILLIGAGWLGKDLAIRLNDAGHMLMAISRSADKCSELKLLDIPAQELSIDSEINVQKIPATTVAIILLPPSSAMGTEFLSYSRLIQSVCNKLKKNGTEYLIHISSSGIYPAKSGMYNEDAEIDTTGRAINLRNAENEELSSGIPAAIIRAGGLCGKDRHPGI